MRSPGHEPDRISSFIAAIAGVGSVYLAHLATPTLALGFLVVPGIIVGATVAIAIRKPWRTK